MQKAGPWSPAPLPLTLRIECDSALSSLPAIRPSHPPLLLQQISHVAPWPSSALASSSQESSRPSERVVQVERALAWPQRVEQGPRPACFSDHPPIMTTVPSLSLQFVREQR